MTSRRALVLLVAFGLVLRLGIVLSAEHRLDSDEVVIGTMAIDILEGRSQYFFYSGAGYNGGAAQEAYLAAAAFAVFGPSELALKLCLLALWLTAALLFVDLVQRVLPPDKASLAVLFFAIGTPFLLEWSVKARGGYAETLLVSVLLLWLAEPPARWAKHAVARCLAFGIATGLGLWASEMLLAWIPLAAFWLLRSVARADRPRAIAALGAGVVLGLLPLIAYNVTHEWAHLRASVLFSLFSPARPRQPLDAEQMLFSAKFVLGQAWPLLMLGLVVAAARLLRALRTPLVAQLGLAHLVAYLLAYWLNGLRYLPVPPSRVLYVTAMSLALVLPYALEPFAASRWVRRASLAAVCLWLALVAVPVAEWAMSGAPREDGSWRGSWSLTDGADLRAVLAEESIEVVYTSLWTGNSLEFATRAARHADPSAPVPLVARRLPLPSGLRAGIVLRDGTSLARQVELALEERGIAFRRIHWQHFLILADIESARVDPQLGLPRRSGGFHSRDWPQIPVPPDGFN